jgi:uracil phosphoribosyltransferase
MLPSALQLFPGAEVAFIGLRRGDPRTAPTVYLNSLPSSLRGRWVFLLDPIIATGGSGAAACDLLDRADATHVTVLAIVATDAGVERIERSNVHPTVVAAAVDPCLDSAFFVVPGLGDVGDRLFGGAG